LQFASQNLDGATGVARNFDWEGPKMKKNCQFSDVFRLRDNDGVNDMTP